MKKFYKVISSLFVVMAVFGAALSPNEVATVCALIAVAYAVLSVGEAA